MTSVDRTNTEPLYSQVYSILYDRIVNRELLPGDQLPPESELVGTYDVSRITVRNAIEMLVKEGWVYRQRGRGTFVAHPKLEYGLSRIVNFTEDMRQRGFEASSRVLFTGLKKAAPSMAEQLRIEPGEELACIERLRLADGEPMCVEKSHLVHRYCPGILNHDYSKNSLRETKTRKYGIIWKRATQKIRAIVPSPDLAEALDISDQTALLYIERISYSQENIPVEFLQAHYRGDQYTLFNELQGGVG